MYIYIYVYIYIYIYIYILPCATSFYPKSLLKTKNKPKVIIQDVAE